MFAASSASDYFQVWLPFIIWYCALIDMMLFFSWPEAMLKSLLNYLSACLVSLPM